MDSDLLSNILGSAVVILIVLAFVFAIGTGIWMLFSMVRERVHRTPGVQIPSVSTRRNLRLASGLFTVMGLVLIGSGICKMIIHPHNWHDAPSSLASGAYSLGIARYAYREWKKPVALRDSEPLCDGQ